MILCVFGVGGGGGGAGFVKKKKKILCQTVSNEVKKKQEHGAYGTIKISKYVINFLCMYKPYNSNFELSSK